MMQEENNPPLTPVPAPAWTVPWSILDTWIAVFLLVLLNIGLLTVAVLIQWEDVLQSAGVILAEMLYLLPVVAIFVWRRVPWNRIGFGRFDAITMGMGCGLLIAAYIFIILHNLLLMALGVDTQGEEILKLFSELKSPVWFFLVGVVIAPIVEEIFFRGFLFQGFRQRYGWVAAMLISSFIFAAAHLDPVAFIPTFILGAVMAYVYHRSNSVWPGIILHFLVNAFAMCAALAAVQLQDYIPT
jgi:membrane protease YdiL (CAAX protease family)